MSLDQDTLARAKKHRLDAVEEIVNDSFPSVARISYGLTGSNTAGNLVVDTIVRKGLVIMPRWRDEGEPQRWFLRHTILQCRQNSPSGGNDDLLIDLSPERPQAYVAFIRALRALPQQQAEAFLLHFGEAFNPRYMAIAMDCSVSAAEQHLAAASATMKSIAGDAYDPLTGLFRQAYHSLTPAGKVRVPHLKRVIRRHVWTRHLWRLTKLIVAIAVMAALAWFGYKILPAIEY